MPEMHLRQPGFTYSACGPFTKNKERIQKLKKTGDSRYIYQNELAKACFQPDIIYGDFKDLPRTAASDEILLDKTFNIAKNPKYDGCQRGIASMVYKCFDKKLLLGQLKMKICQTKSYLKNYTNQLLENFKKEKYTRLLQTIFGSLILLILS